MPTTLETCLGISGSFEGGNGKPRFDLICGGADGMGLSAGALQWNAGQGTLQTLLKNTIGSWPIAEDELKPLWLLKDMAPAQAVPYALQQWGTPDGKNVTPEAKALWTKLLLTPQCVAAQLGLASVILTSALVEAAKFLPWQKDVATNLRIAAFFFDLHVQQGSLAKRMPDGSHKPDPLSDPSQADPGPAIALMTAEGHSKTAAAWQAAASADPLAAVLLTYAYERAEEGNPAYVGDTLSRRGAIACRYGLVHGSVFDFTTILP